MDRGTLFPVKLQHSTYQSHQLPRNLVGLFIVTLKNLGEQIFFIQPFERECPDSQFIHQNTQRPDVSFLAVVAFFLDHLRSNVMRSATKVIEHLSFLKFDTKSEVNDLNVESIVKQNIFHLYISMCDILFMQVVKS